MSKPMKIYPNLVTGIIQGLTDIFQNNKQADRVVERLLKSNPKWGSRDRKFIANNIYSVVRWYRLLHEILGSKPKSEKDWWNILGIQWTIQGETLPPFDEFKELNTTDIIAKKKELDSIPAIRESFPEWLNQLGVKELGRNWHHCMESLNVEQDVYLRVNTLKTTPDKCLATLKKEGIDVAIFKGDCLVLNKRAKLAHLKSFQKGLYEIQDHGSQQIAQLLNPTPNSYVIDTCSGAGGKTLHLASIMKNQGTITAMDIHDYKLKELKKRCSRAGVNIVKSSLINDKTIHELKESADFLLMDVPCSGLGVLKRNPDAKWKLSESFIREIQSVQQQILSTYPDMLKPGGKMVYATCSILPSENQLQIEEFLKSHKGKNFSLISEKTIFPYNNNSDGFYMAEIIKRTK